jgi:ABC-type multidrug transport system fused ATPase/permease subunit
VEFKYPQAEESLFSGLSFQIKKGEYVAFVGQSGSGKSTITKLIERFYQIQSGDIFFGKENSSGLNIKHLRGQIGVVSQ